MSLLKRVLYFFLVLVLMIVLCSLYITYSKLTKPMFSSGPPMIIELKPNSSANALVDLLFTKKLIDSKILFLNFIKFKGFAARLKAGIYQISSGESAQNFIERVVKGDVLRLSFRIIEGTTCKQIAQNLKNAAYLNYQDSPGQCQEGMLLADTYYYFAGSQARNILEKAHQNLQNTLESSWQKRSLGLPYKNSYELLIAASILEKETAIPRERQLIAGIIVNRLKKHMPLQMDPTIVYALGEHYKGKLRHEDMNIDSSYNTYRYRGLPPTPIAMVGKLAIEAAAQPEFSDYLYFVAKGDGSHIFSKSYEEQKKAIARGLLKQEGGK